MIVIDPVRHRDRRAGRLPPARAAGHRRLVPGRARRRARAGGPRRRRLPRRAHDRRRARARRAGARADRRLRRALRRRRGADPRRGAADRRRRTASSVFEDLGIQQAPNSVLCSYLNKLLWMLTGSFAKPGAMHLHSWMAPLARYDARERPHPGHRRADHRRPGALQRDRRGDPHRPPRAPARDADRELEPRALARRLRSASARRWPRSELVVVIDVAMTETARHADYVLPAASQFEKWEATFFNLEFPRNTFHLRAPLMEPLPGTLPEPEIYAGADARARRARERARSTRCARPPAAGRAEFAAAFGAGGGSRPADLRARVLRALRDARPDAARRERPPRRRCGAWRTAAR